MYFSIIIFLSLSVFIGKARLEYVLNAVKLSILSSFVMNTRTRKAGILWDTCLSVRRQLTEPHRICLQMHSAANHFPILLNEIGAFAEFKSCHPYQISTVIMIRKRIVKAVLVFYSKALIYKTFSCFYGLVECQYQNYKHYFYWIFEDLNLKISPLMFILTLNKR